MVDNLFFLFLDEIFTSNLNDLLKYNKNEIFNRDVHLHFGVSGIFIAASDLKDYNFKSRNIKTKYYPSKNNLVFHYIDILHKRDQFHDLYISTNKFKAFTASLSSFIENSNFKYTCVFVDKHELIKKYGIFDNSGRLIKMRKIGSNLFPKSKIVDYNLYLLCLKTILTSFFNFITHGAMKARGIIVAEARGEREDSELRDAFHKIHINGIGSIKPKELRSFILDLLIVPKKQNYIGTQIADLVLYPTYDAIIPSHNVRSDHFILYDKILKRKFIKNSKIVIP